MSSFAIIGSSQAVDPQEAAYQAASMIKNQTKNTPIDTVLLFTSIHYVQKEVLEAVHSILKPAKLVGSSSAGIIIADALTTRGLVLVAMTGTALNFSTGFTLHTTGQDMRQFGFELTRKMTLDYKSNVVKQAALVFSDGMLSYNDDFILGAQETLGHTCALLGSFSCDDFKFKKTFQFCQKHILSRAAAGLIIGSATHHIAFSCKNGFIPLGKPRLITSAEGPVIRTIDDKPALHLYEEFFQGDLESFKRGFLKSPAVIYPLGIYLDRQRQYLIRYPVDILDDGSIVCQAQVPSGTEVHLMINNKDSCKAAATAAALEIKKNLDGRTPQLLLIFESVIRHKIMGHSMQNEIRSIKEVLGSNVPVAGMYSFGEISRLEHADEQDTTELQNGSMLLIAVG